MDFYFCIPRGKLVLHSPMYTNLRLGFLVTPHLKLHHPEYDLPSLPHIVGGYGAQAHTNASPYVYDRHIARHSTMIDTVKNTYKINVKINTFFLRKFLE